MMKLSKAFGSMETKSELHDLAQRFYPHHHHTEIQVGSKFIKKPLTPKLYHVVPVKPWSYLKKSWRNVLI